MIRPIPTRLALPAAMACALLVPALALGAEDDDVAAAHAAADQYADVAAAETAGYGLPPEGPLHECIASFDDTGAMGLHYINGDLVGDTDLDPATPEALIYEPAADGSLTMVAAEYVVFAEAWDDANDEPPVLFDQMFMLVEEPNRYELPAFYALHAWLWKDNPSGTYAAFNPDVVCPAGELPDTAAPANPSMPSLGLFGLTLVGVALSASLRLALGRSTASAGPVCRTPKEVH